MRIGRRSVLLGGTSSLALSTLTRVEAGSPPSIPPELYDPGIQAMTHAVRDMVNMLRHSLIAVDPADLRVVLQGGGRGAFGQGMVMGRPAQAAMPRGGAK